MSRKFHMLLAVVLVAVMALGLLPAAPAATAEDIPMGGTVVVNESPQGNWPGPAWNPLLTGSSQRQGFFFIFEPLGVFNAVDGGKVTWWLAADGKYSDDLKSYTITLRKGVKWSDGQDFSGKDVAFSLDLIKKFPALDSNAIWELLDSYKLVDDFTLQFNLKQVYTQADTRILQLRPVPQHIWSKVEDPVKFTNEKPVGTGPFTEVTFSPTVYTICRNPNYWQKGLPYVDCLRYPAYSGNDAVNAALINGEVDWAGNYVPDIQKTFVDKDPKNRGYNFWSEGAKPVVLYFNTTKAPFDDVKVRMAISQAFDRAKIPDAVYGPGYIAGDVNPLGLATGRYKDWISQPALDKAKELGVGGFNVDNAKKLLDEAGLKMGSDKFRTTKDGKPLAIKLQTVNGWTDWTAAAQVIAQSLQDIGLNVSIDTPEFGTWFSNLQAGTYDMSMGWADYLRTPWDFYSHMFDGAYLVKGADGKVTANSTAWAHWSSPATDKLFKDFTLTNDLAKQKEIMAQIEMAYVTNVMSTPVMWNALWYEYNQVRFTGFPTKENWYAQGSPWENVGNSALIVALKIHCVDATSCGQKK